MSEPESPLEARDVAYLRQLRDVDRPSPEVQARVRARLAASVLAMQPGGSSPARAGSVATGSAAGKAAIAAVAFLVGGAVGAGVYAGLHPPPPPRIVYLPQPSVPVPSVAPAVPPVTESSEALPPSPPPEGSVTRPSPSSTSSTTPSSKKAQLAAERLLLDEARAALVQGDPGRALARIETHRRTFANPILAEERDAMEVEALVKAGRTSEAKAKADAFRRRMPNSLFLPTVDSAVRSIP
jgi:hypothetical protein